MLLSPWWPLRGRSKYQSTSSLSSLVWRVLCKLRKGKNLKRICFWFWFLGFLGFFGWLPDKTKHGKSCSCSSMYLCISTTTSFSIGLLWQNLQEAHELQRHCSCGWVQKQLENPGKTFKRGSETARHTQRSVWPFKTNTRPHIYLRCFGAYILPRRAIISHVLLSFLLCHPPHPLNLLLWQLWFQELPPMVKHSTQGVALMALIWLLSVAVSGDTADVCFSPQDALWTL